MASARVGWGPEAAQVLFPGRAREQLQTPCQILVDWEPAPGPVLGQALALGAAGLAAAQVGQARERAVEVAADANTPLFGSRRPIKVKTPAANLRVFFLHWLGTRWHGRATGKAAASGSNCP